MEAVWKGKHKLERRKPDVSALFDGKFRVAFEVQLSTTFLRVMAERRVFYQENGGLLIWVFKDCEGFDARMTTQDVFYNNNRNVFVVNEETRQASLAAGAMCLATFWFDPAAGEQIATRIARFDELTLDRERQRAFLVDVDAVVRRHDGEELRQRFDRYVLARWSGKLADEALAPVWRSIRQEFLGRSIDVPVQLFAADGLRWLLVAGYSARLGAPVGTRYKTLIELGHALFDRHKGALWLYRLMLKAHDRGPHVRREKGAANWKTKVDRYRLGLRLYEPEFHPDARYARLLQFVFPEVAEDLVADPRRVLDAEEQGRRSNDAARRSGLLAPPIQRKR